MGLVMPAQKTVPVIKTDHFGNFEHAVHPLEFYETEALWYLYHTASM